MIKGRKIVDEKNNGEFLIFEPTFVENVNPIDYFRELSISSNFGINHSFLKKSLEYHKFHIREETIVKHSLKEASENWNKYYNRIKDTEVPKNLLLAVIASKKDEQEKLLKNIL